MTKGVVEFQHFDYGHGEASDEFGRRYKVLLFKDKDGGLQINVVFTLEEFEAFKSKVLDVQIIEAKVIPNETQRSIEKIEKARR